jgi:hypothetical protein
MERIFFHDAKICVSNAQVIVQGRAHPLDEAVAVEQTIDDPACIGFVTLIAITALAWLIMLTKPHSLISAAPFLLGGLFMATAMLGSRKLYVVSLVRLGERIDVLRSDNHDVALAVREAITTALLERHSTAS